MTKWMRPILSQELQVLRVDPVSFKQLLGHELLHILFHCILLHSARRGDPSAPFNGLGIVNFSNLKFVLSQEVLKKEN